MMSNIHEKLSRIQQELKAPKDLHNSFGNYEYRSAESIIEAVKPYLGKYNVSILLSNEIVFIEGRFYVKATACMYDIESEQHIETVAYAREMDTKKGMDDAQVTGSSISFSRKYALCGLLLIDDNRDPDSSEDTRNSHENVEASKRETAKKAGSAKQMDPNAPAPEEMLIALSSEAERTGMLLDNYLAKKNIDDIRKMTVEHCQRLLNALKGKPTKQQTPPPEDMPDDYEELPFV